MFSQLLWLAIIHCEMQNAKYPISADRYCRVHGHSHFTLFLFLMILQFQKKPGSATVVTVIKGPPKVDPQTS